MSLCFRVWTSTTAGDWSVHQPVVRFDFSAGDYTDPDYLQDEVVAQLDAIERRVGLPPGHAEGSIRFPQIIEALHECTRQRVVVLVGEYDKPILDALAQPDAAQANREALYGLYSAIKFSDAHVKFTLLTGVSTFSKMSLFSRLNNLKDMTLDPRGPAVCGYTDRDLDAVFAAELPGLDRNEIRRWYGGYGRLGEKKVYHPFDVLLLFDTRGFRVHWVRDRHADVSGRDAVHAQGHGALSRTGRPGKTCCPPSTSRRCPPKPCCSRPVT